jgi:serine/threonine protein kinase
MSPGKCLEVNDVTDSAQRPTVVPIREKSTLLVGTILRNRYVLEQLLGEGGMGRVFLATDTEVEGPERFVAIKVLGDVFGEHPQSLSVLKKEAVNARKLTHPNIVRVHGFDNDGANFFIVMEYVRGETLDHFIKRHHDGLPYNEAWPIISDCASALSYMHSKEIVHSDFKPGNVFRTLDGEIKILDLGLARTIDETVAMNGQTRFGSPGGSTATPLGLTPQYASCEMWEPGTSPDARDDIYALGCVTYELLTGRHPFESLPAPSARAQGLAPPRPPRIRRRQWRALKQALSFNRESRTRTADEFRKDLDRQRPRANATPWIILTAVLAAVAITAGILFRPPSADTRFVEEEIAANPIGGRRAANPEDILGLNQQASEGLNLARSALQKGDYPAAAYYLSDGPTSALFSFQRLLAKSSTPDDVRAGAEGMLELSKLYATAAVGLRKANEEDALRWSCRGLQINPYEDLLRSLYAELKELTTHNGTDIEPCGAIDWKSTTPP